MTTGVSSLVVMLSATISAITLTVSETVSVAVEKAVVPPVPLAAILKRPPLLPCVRSQARIVSASLIGAVEGAL